MDLLTVYTELLKSGKTPKPLSEEQIAMLEAPLPDEAIKAIPGKRGLNAINPVFIYELYNKVFGIGGWTQSGQGTVKNKESMGKLEFLCVDHLIYRDSYGGNKNDDSDDADLLKGYYSDATTKIASMISSGVMKVWKNHYSPNYKENTNSSNSTSNSSQSVEPKWVNTLGDTNFNEASKKIKAGEIKSEEDLRKFGFAFNTKNAGLKAMLLKEILA
jgi:hypothetical protein